MSHVSHPFSKQQAPASRQSITALVGGVFDEAVRRHQAGQLAEAARLYEQILKVDPRHADSLHLLGMIAHRAQKPELAIALIGKAIVINGEAAAYHSNLGTILQAQSKLDEATACYERALALDPKLAEVHLNLGLVLHIRGKLDEAVAEYRSAAALKPRLAEAHSNLGNALQTQGKLDEAVAEYERALKLKPEFAEAWYNQGNALHAQEKLDEAARSYQRAIELKPNLAEAHCNLGNIYQKQEKIDLAKACFERAIEFKPEYAEAHYNLGNILAYRKNLKPAVAHYEQALRYDPKLTKAHNNLGNVFRALEQPEEAAAQYRQVPEGDPEFTDAYNNLGLAYLSLGRHGEAIDSIRRALALKPDLAEAHCNLGAVLHAQNRIAEATESYQRALALDPDLVKARLNTGMIQLVSGNFAEGWKNYELRWEDAPLHRRDFKQPQWRGEPLNGARILLHAEQGYGDTLQFLRYAPMVHAAGGTVILEVQKRLQRLAAELLGVAEVVCQGDLRPSFDWQCPLLSLPLAFGTTLETIPAQTPYLSVPEEAREKMDSLPWPESGLRVGLIWSGNPTFLHDRYRFRSIPLPLFRPIFETAGVHLFSLQVGEATAQLARAPGAITDLSPSVSDMADTAAQIAKLDLVISADTSVPHLAAALGIPTWVLMPYSPDWRWLQEREDCPWYPSMRLFRQSQPGEWEPVMRRVRSALVERLLSA